MNIKFLLRSNIKSAFSVHNSQRILSRVPYNRKYMAKIAFSFSYERFVHIDI